MTLKEKFRSFIANLFGANSLAEENTRLKTTAEELRTDVSELTVEKANLLEEVVTERTENVQLRKERVTLLLEKQTYEECLLKLEAQLQQEREAKEDAKDECAALRRKCAALETTVDSLSDQLAGLSAAHAGLTRAKADLEVSKSLAESKAVEHMREKTVSARQRDKLASENRMLIAETAEVKKAYGRTERISNRSRRIYRLSQQAKDRVPS